MGQRAREVEDTGFQNPTRPAGQPGAPLPSLGQHPLQRRAPRAAGRCAGETNFGEFPHSALRTDNSSSKRALPRHLVPIPPPTPSHSLKIQKSLNRASSPPSTGRDGLPDPQLEPPTPRWKRSLRPASRQDSGSVYTSVFPVPRNQKSTHSDKALISQLCQRAEKPQDSPPPAPRPPRSRKPYKTGSETVSRYHRLCQESQTLLTSSLFFPQSKSLI